MNISIRKELAEDYKITEKVGRQKRSSCAKMFI